MQILFILVGILGLIMIFFGSKLLIKRRNKIIAELKLTSSENQINFENPGLYSISIVGGGYAKNIANFKIKILSSSFQLDAVEKKNKLRFHYKGRLATEFYQFEIVETGIYKFLFKAIEDLEVKESMLASKRLFQKKLPLENIGIVVREASPNWTYIVGLTLTIIGLQIMLLGITLVLNPQLYN